MHKKHVQKYFENYTWKTADLEIDYKDLLKIPWKFCKIEHNFAAEMSAKNTSNPVNVASRCIQINYRHTY